MPPLLYVQECLCFHWDTGTQWELVQKQLVTSMEDGPLIKEVPMRKLFPQGAGLQALTFSLI